MTENTNPVTFDDVNGHRGNRLMLMLFAYESTKDILSMNGYEVLRFIQEIELGRFSVMALDPKRRMEYRDFQNHLIRYFHNFLAGAKTLVEHTRNMMRRGEITDAHQTAYKAQVEAIFSDPLSKFVGDFRNYTLHYGLPKLAHVCSLPEESWEVALSLRELQEWDGWTARSREFIRSHPEQIRLSWLVGSYQKKAMELHEWLVKSFTEHYGGVFQEFDALRASFRAQQGGEQSPPVSPEGRANAPSGSAEA